MTVKELMALLAAMPPDREVRVDTDELGLMPVVAASVEKIRLYHYDDQDEETEEIRTVVYLEAGGDEEDHGRLIREGEES